MSIAVEFVGDGLIGGLVGIGSAEDKAAAKDERLRGGPRTDERFDLSARIGGENDRRTEGERHCSLRAHRERSCPLGDYGKSRWNRPAARQLLANWRGIYEMDI